MADAADLKSALERGAGSIPAMPTTLVPYLSSDKIDVHWEIPHRAETLAIKIIENIAKTFKYRRLGT